MFTARWTGVALAVSLHMCASVAQAALVTRGDFDVSTSGEAAYTLPVRVPPGIAGVEPKLAFVYGSQNGDGLLGIGWSLSGLSVITRCPQTKAQDNDRKGVAYTYDDRYCLNGQRLILVPGTGSYGTNEAQYRTERESFSKIVSYGTAGNGPAYFKVWTRNGHILEFGNTADSRIEAQGKSSVSTWAMNRLQDTKGNYLTVSYTETATDGSYYPLAISYTGNAVTGTAPASSVEFVYTSRQKAIPHYVAGSVRRNTSLLSEVKVYSGGSLAWSYRAKGYTQAAGKFPRLTGIEECVTGSPCEEAAALNWKTTADGSFSNPSAFNLKVGYLAESNGHTGSLLGDFNADGKTDILRWNDDPAYNILFLSDGNGGFTSAPAFNLQTSHIKESNGAVGSYTGDFNGDGKTDILRWGNNAANNHLWLSNGNGSFSGASAFNLQSSYIEESNGNTGAFMGDFNGDGRTDILRWGTNPANNFLWLSNGDGGFSSAAAFTSGPFDMRGVHLRESDGKTGSLLGDFNGDGKTDILRWNDNPAYNHVFLASGDGGFALSSVFNIKTSILKHSDRTVGAVLGDFNGDGKTDILRWCDDPVYNYIWFSNGDGSFTGASAFNITTSLMTHSDNTLGIFLGDFNGDGKTDIFRWSNDPIYNLLWLSNGDGSFASGSAFNVTGSILTRSNGDVGAWVGDFNGDGKADLLRWCDDPIYNELFVPNGDPALVSRIKDRFGATVDVNYKPLTDSSVYTRDSSAVSPVIDIQFPLYVVSSAVVSNGIGGSTTTNYKYGGLKVERDGRGLLGFRWMRTTVSDTGNGTYTEFRQDWPYTGLPALVQKTVGSGSGVIEQATNTYQCKQPGVSGSTTCPLAPGNRYFPYLSQSVRVNWDLSGPMFPYVIQTNTLDDWGNPTQVVEQTYHPSGTYSGHSKTTTNVYANDTTNWLLGLLLRSTVTSTTP